MPTPELTRIRPAETEQSYEAEYFLPAVQVDNEVEWVNQNVELPFPLVPGSSTEAALMVLPDDSNLEPDAMVLGVSGHQRSVLIARQAFSDARGATYRDIDLKGSGYVEWSPEKRAPGKSERGLVGRGFGGDNWGNDRSNPLGLLDIDSARRDQAFGEIFNEGGVRVALPLAIIRLKEIIDENGQKVSIDEARRLGILARDFDPAIELRGFGTRHRVSNWGLMAHGMSREGLNDAMTLVANELSMNPDEFTPNAYLLWFAKTLGEQIRLIQEMGFAHGGLHSQNITLDCRLADFDTSHLLPSDKEDRERIVEGEGMGSFMFVRTLRNQVAEFYPELKMAGHETEEGLDPDSLDFKLWEAYKEAYEQEAKVAQHGNQS